MTDPDDMVLVRRGDLLMLTDQASDSCGWPGENWRDDPQAVRVFAALNGPAAVRAVAESDTELVISDRLPPGAQIVNADFHEPIDFDTFWRVYPRREGKKAARKAWDRALKDGAEPQAIIIGAFRYRDLPGREDRFTAHPTTWLNQGRWEDELVDRTEQSKTDRNRVNLTAAARDQIAGRTMSLAERMAIAGGQRQIEGGS